MSKPTCWWKGYEKGQANIKITFHLLSRLQIQILGSFLNCKSFCSKTSWSSKSENIPYAMEQIPRELDFWLRPVKIRTLVTSQKDASSPWLVGWMDVERSPRWRVIRHTDLPLTIDIGTLSTCLVHGSSWLRHPHPDGRGKPKRRSWSQPEKIHQACKLLPCIKAREWESGCSHFLWCTEQYWPFQVLQDVKVWFLWWKQLPQWR